MARLRTSPRSKKVRKCGKCGDEIKVGQQYRYWSSNPYYGGTGKHIRCMKPECTPQIHELTTSKMGTVYSAQEEARQNSTDVDEMKASLENLAAVARDVGDEYQSSADTVKERFSSGNSNTEEWESRAEQLNDYADNLEDVDLDLPACEECENGKIEDDCPECEGSGTYTDEETEEEERCANCEGTGRVEEDCEVCQGTGLQSGEEALEEVRERFNEAIDALEI